MKLEENYKDMIRVAKRENNTKRSYLVVNRFQGKHVPVDPERALELFRDLAEILKRHYKNEKLLLVGFAETATAIGSAVAVRLGTNYIQTTREDIPATEYIYFSEEHSHAVEQRLIKADIDKVAEETDRIIFIEDEITTGKTILNAINSIDKVYPGRFEYSVGSILNGMTDEILKDYKSKDIGVHFIGKADYTGFTGLANSFTEEGEYIEPDTDEYVFMNKVPVLNLFEKEDARRLTSAEKYQEFCDKSADVLLEYCEKNGKLSDKSVKNILVIGTEEFMYPVIYTADRIKEVTQAEVRTHSTTRSPIAVFEEDNYPFHKRYELVSLYEDERRTFIYDIDKYDIVIIVTDAELKKDGVLNNKGLNTLLNAVSKAGNDNIIVVGWCD